MGKTYIESYDDPSRTEMVYTIHIAAKDYVTANFTKFDHLLFDDIDHGKSSDTPLADKLLGLETIVRRIEKANRKES